MSPQPKKDQPNTPDAAPVATLEKGQHNPFLEGLIQEGKAANDAIHGWYATRDNLRTLARQAVGTEFCSPEQAEAVAKLWPMPKRTKKGEGQEATTEATQNAA